MLQIISAGIGCVVLGLAGWMWYFTGSGNTSPAGHDFGSGLSWLTLLLYIIGFGIWAIGLPALLIDPRRYRVILQLASAVVYFWPVVAIVVAESNDHHLGMHVCAKYTVEWKCPVAWRDTDFHCEVERAGGLDSCQVKRQPIVGDVLEMLGGPVFVQNEQQIIRLYTLGKGGEDYLFCVDLHAMKKAGDVSDWIVARSSKLASLDARNDARKRFFRHGDPEGFPLVENPTVTMRYKIVSIERQRGR
ncbi:MAG: hypothetical protein ABFC54_11120 [Thermoguttaceae bacterium]